MKKQTILYFLLAFLIISNGFFLVRYLGKPDRKNHKPGSFIVQELKFDEKQIEAYDSVKTVHFDKVKAISENIRGLKKAMFSKISDETLSQNYLDSITDLIAIEEKKKDLEMFTHFKNVREICNEKQKEQLSKIINDAINRRGKRGKHRNKG